MVGSVCLRSVLSVVWVASLGKRCGQCEISRGSADGRRRSSVPMLRLPARLPCHEFTTCQRSHMRGSGIAQSCEHTRRASAVDFQIYKRPRVGKSTFPLPMNIMSAIRLTSLSGLTRAAARSVHMYASFCYCCVLSSIKRLPPSSMKHAVPTASIACTPCSAAEAVVCTPWATCPAWDHP